jgi:hypothetical protein
MIPIPAAFSGSYAERAPILEAPLRWDFASTPICIR